MLLAGAVGVWHITKSINEAPGDEASSTRKKPHDGRETQPKLRRAVVAQVSTGMYCCIIGLDTVGVSMALIFSPV